MCPPLRGSAAADGFRRSLGQAPVMSPRSGALRCAKEHGGLRDNKRSFEIAIEIGIDPDSDSDFDPAWNLENRDMVLISGLDHLSPAARRTAEDSHPCHLRAW